jgi:hypothetical protein
VLAATLIVLTAPIVTFLSITLLPAVNNLVTKLTTNNWVKIFVSLVTAFLAGLLAMATADNGTAVISTELLYQWAIIFLGQMLVHRGIYKPTGIPQKLAPSKGI